MVVLDAVRMVRSSPCFSHCPKQRSTALLFGHCQCMAENVLLSDVINDQSKAIKALEDELAGAKVHILKLQEQISQLQEPLEEPHRKVVVELTESLQEKKQKVQRLFISHPINTMERVKDWVV